MTPFSKAVYFTLFMSIGTIVLIAFILFDVLNISSKSLIGFGAVSGLLSVLLWREMSKKIWKDAITT